MIVHRTNPWASISVMQAAINSSKISASFDHPEGLLDALMQVAVCTVSVVLHIKMLLEKSVIYYQAV